ncbi:hypothetical protein QO259_17035 [Salinicola sp. JS01]|uniref:hypothetical protein n=1 Tax=Salinicola sp. JS01 TaxID=3050071 RepID=UPI00255BCBDA|nr:hypothetical protein [Salinicola sp. JS01]WIX32493.1 hypothetical protein QO259_17035 [Salinicola sp. JS01]
MNYRAALERWAQTRRDRGWHEGRPPADQWIEYHATHAQFVYSGRCRIDELDPDDRLAIGSHAHIMLNTGQAQIRYLFWRPAAVEALWGPRCMDLITGGIKRW